MREKIARSIYDRDDRSGFWADWDDLDANDPTRRQFLLAADAVLDALMEPDATMMRAGADASPMWQTDSPDTYAIAVHDVADIFVAMIQAAKDGK